MGICERLKQARLAANLTQEAVAEKVGVSRQTISNWENGKSYPDIVSVIILSDIYGLTLDSLLKGDEKMIKHLKDSTDAVKSNKKLWLGICVSLAALAAMTLLRVLLPTAPLLDSVAANILIVMLFVFTFIALFSKTTEIKALLERKAPYRVIAKTGVIILYVLFCIPLVLLIPETINTEFQIENWLIQGIIRVGVGFAFLLPALAIFKKMKLQ